MKQLEVCLDYKSNCRNNNQFVVQAWSNVDGWQDTKSSSNDEQETVEMARVLFNDRNKWMNNNPTAVRVVSSLGKKHSSE